MERRLERAAGPQTQWQSCGGLESMVIITINFSIFQLRHDLTLLPESHVVDWNGGSVGVHSHKRSILRSLLYFPGSHLRCGTAVHRSEFVAAEIFNVL